MAGRGRGRGGRGFRGGFTFAPQKPFELFPEDVKLPDVKLPDVKPDVKVIGENENKKVDIYEEMKKFQNYWKASPYFLEEKREASQSMCIARYSEQKKKKFTRDSLSQILVFNDFPKELVKGKSRQIPSRKKFRWNPELDLKRIEFFEQQEKQGQGQEDKDEEENKDEENEDENVEDEAGSDENEFGDDDYLQGEHFDDDEDDYNAADDGDDEPTY